MPGRSGTCPAYELANNVRLTVMQATKPLCIKLEAGQKYQRLFAGIPQTRGMRSGHVRLQPQESIGAHNTDAREEAIVILSGKAEIHTGESDVFVAEADSVIYMPPHTRHDVKNIGREVLRYVYVVSPLCAPEEPRR